MISRLKTPEKKDIPVHWEQLRRTSINNNGSRDFLPPDFFMIRTHLRRDLWTIHGAEESSGVNSSPARAAGQVVGKNLIRLNSSEFKNSTSGPLINSKSMFKFGFDFAEILEFLKSSVVCTTNFALRFCNKVKFLPTILPRIQTLRCASYCGAILRSVHPTAESSFVVSITLRS